jgi:hypothetical protein
MIGPWRKRVVGLAAVVAGLATGCETAPKTSTGAGVGAALGAGTGALIGADGDARDREQADVRRAQAEAAQQYARGQLSLDDVIQMSRPANGQPASDDLIVDYIRSTNSRFELSPGDVGYLRSNGVSDRVVREMVNSRGRRLGIATSRPETVVIREEPPPVVVYERRGPYWYGPPPWYRPRPVVYVPPPPPPTVGFGVTIRK